MNLYVVNNGKYKNRNMNLKNTKCFTIIMLYDYLLKVIKESWASI